MYSSESTRGPTDLSYYRRSCGTPMTFQNDPHSPLNSRNDVISSQWRPQGLTATTDYGSYDVASPCGTPAPNSDRRCHSPSPSSSPSSAPTLGALTTGLGSGGGLLSMSSAASAASTASANSKRRRARRTPQQTAAATLERSRRFPCTHCCKTFVMQRTLRSHLKSHSNPRPYECVDCGKRFANRNTLVCHLRVHTKEKPYTCSLCFRSFTQASSLKSHVICMHTKRFPHVCSVCGRGFISPSQLREHLAREHDVAADAVLDINDDDTAVDVISPAPPNT